ncbi:Hsp20/alpha crystallin family protein [Prevotella sp. A2931]|uniref:Hsp20/alpha crystallin family protein n=1 Tax=Prevotella illustrans TaxID=2800387 RepID=A0ABS3M471_9BACT|nr:MULTISPECIES: Hsp20/alpha crystallin family protein [Prevotella]MBO1362974.1 Hsp20/alpha crystallin family protein [Prevotella illustrans]PTL27124.1 heat-shock protein [Prevotella sp. oral taxon 820]
MLFPVLRSNDWLDNAFNDFFDNRALARMNATAPAVNVKEDEKSYTMEIAVPGIKKEFCRVAINDDGDLELAIENKMEHKEENKGEKKEHYLRREFSYSNYQQVYTLPDDVDKEHISAKVNNGVLTIDMPKLAKAEKKIQRSITVG